MGKRKKDPVPSLRRRGPNQRDWIGYVHASGHIYIYIYGRGKRGYVISTSMSI